MLSAVLINSCSQTWPKVFKAGVLTEFTGKKNGGNHKDYRRPNPLI
jgi:hypothetical protein